MGTPKVRRNVSEMSSREILRAIDSALEEAAKRATRSFKIDTVSAGIAAEEAPLKFRHDDGRPK